VKSTERPELSEEKPVAPQAAGWIRFSWICHPQHRIRLAGCLSFVALLTVAFAKPLVSLVVYAAGSDLNSHILLVPFISGYLLRLRRKELPPDYVCSPGFAIVPFVFAIGAFAAERYFRSQGFPISENDTLALKAFSFVCFLAAGGFLFLGRQWMTKACFPVAFLIFMIPLPDAVTGWLQTASKLASADVAYFLFRITGVPILRNGTVFQLPDITFEIASECSGIHSSWVLFVTSLLASWLMLESPWRRLFLLAFVIPLGVLRNGFRVLVIGTLCIHFGPNMIHSVIHKQGGPLFFVLSLFPLFLLLWWLRNRERAGSGLQQIEEAQRTINQP
jgi:exosortase C (VPDSG-CTERM-specific)